MLTEMLNKTLQGAFKGLTMFSEAVVHSVTGSKPSQSPKKYELAPPDENGHRPGIVSIVDLKAITGPGRDMVGGWTVCVCVLWVCVCVCNVVSVCVCLV